MEKNRNYPFYEPEKYGSMNQMVCAKARKCKDAAAFAFMRGKNFHSVSYRRFLEDILVTGRYLSDFVEHKPPYHAAILGENSYQWLVAFMAVVMSGNVAVPLDKELDGAGIAGQLMDSDSTVCIYSASYEDIADALGQGGQKLGVQFLSMDALEGLQESTAGSGSLQGHDARKENRADDGLLEQWNAALNPKALSALFFTSGTSAKRKMVMLSQENMASDICFACRNFCSEANTFTALPFHHSFGLLTAVFALFNWEHEVFINSGLKHVKRDMLVSKPRTMLLVPLFVETFHRTIWQTARAQGNERKLRLGIVLSVFLLRIGIDIRKKLFHSVLEGFGGNLKYIICGGAPLQEKYVREFRAIGIEILNGYGITECAPVVAVNRNQYHRDGSVGQVVCGCDVRIRTDSSHAGPGEIQVKGKNVMLGYYRDEEATKEAFDEGWFKTGDLGFIDRNGFLYVTGRKKNLIILSNGENVSPEELEALLLDYEPVREAVVYAEEGLITAEIFPDEEAEQEEEALVARLQDIVDRCNRKLPSYKRIRKVKIRGNEFDKTTTRKIKRSR